VIRAIALRIACALAGWAVPGSGHVLRGERAKGVLLAVVLLGCFLAGEAMSAFHAVSWYEHGIAFLAQIGAGAPTLAFTAYDAARHEQRLENAPSGPIPVPRLLDCGIMYTCVAGLLNFVLVIDLLFPLAGRKRREEP
jgi:hypothetical protein